MVRAGRRGQAAPVGLEAASQLGRMGRQPDHETEVAEPPAIGLAQHGAAAGGQDDRPDAPPSTRRGSVPPSRERPIRRSR